MRLCHRAAFHNGGGVRKQHVVVTPSKADSSRQEKEGKESKNLVCPIVFLRVDRQLARLPAQKFRILRKGGDREVR